VTTRAIAVLAVLGLAACARQPLAAKGFPRDAVDNAVATAIGDPTTCLLLKDDVSGKTIYRYGDAFNCERPLPACDRSGALTAQTAFVFAAAGRDASCPSTPDGSRSVGWAEGRTEVAGRHLTYSAVMEGQRALPGHEMAARFADALFKAGL
jgi:hypothetical protein